MLNTEDIAFIHSKRGMISLHMKDNQRYITDHSSLESLEKKLHGGEFFRINRQYLVNREIIDLIKHDVNRKLKVYFKPHITTPDEEVKVSRYKHNQLMEWLDPSSR